MQKKSPREPSKKYIFFDFETKLNNEGKHVVNYCVVQYFNGPEHVFNTAGEFCKWIFKKHHKGFTVIAHYGKGYDFQFVQERLVAHSTKPKIVLNGQKILQLEVKQDYNIRFIDSISFISMPLRDFHKTFGISELTKGHFPHKFNRDENQIYVGKYPDKKDYGYYNMTEEAREDFDVWYDTTSRKVFNFKDEMYLYCKSDVDILRRGCIKLRELFLQKLNIDPFQYMTIASAKWFKYISMYKNINIRHTCNEGRRNIKNKEVFFNY